MKNISNFIQVKRTAMAELQKAVAMAERRAMDLVANERIKMERIISAASKTSLDADLAKEPKPDIDTPSANLDNQVKFLCWANKQNK